ncbi:MAG: FAD-binding oxidoreductase [Bacillota bacterium]|jgi:dihydroorotate dehydrogenase electron transfer subunit|nr:dihydroorotate dehydrogenase electron transfer subunit [Bacillota bacterium]HOC06313.1 FAD-binding oxidoreductase [Bacillota bacterium]HQD20277.1 FAD-binding oxidoreductase [Bacillota bacterium]
MRERKAVLLAHETLTEDTFRIVLHAPEIAAGVEGGQFVHLQVPGFSLRRPFTVADADAETITLIIRRQGRGTAALEQVKPGSRLAFLGPLGNGFRPLPGQGLLLGGGIGTAALILLARRLGSCTLVMGGRSSGELWLDQVHLPPSVVIQYASDDGSQGFAGNLVQYARKNLKPGMWVAACGPRRMLAGLQELLRQRKIPGQFALEERMACGLGACRGCTCDTVKGNALVCKDGPVFAAEEVVFS